MQNSDNTYKINRELFEPKRSDLFDASIAFAITILLHSFFYAAASSNLINFTRTNQINEDKHEIAVELLPPPEQKILPEYVEANPNANDLMPDETNQESFKNQRAAEENPDEGSMSRRPYTEGDLKGSTKIVSGDMQDSPPAQAAMEVLKTRERPLENYKNSSSSNSNDDAKKNEALHESHSIDGTILGAIRKSEEAQAPKKNPEEKKEEEDKKTSEETEMEIQKAVQETTPAPRQRPSLSLKIPAGPLADNRMHAGRLGAIAIDSRFSEFGAYMQRMVEAVSRQWHLLASQYDLSASSNSNVELEFYLNMMGELTSLKIHFTNATSIATTLCEQAIVTTAPYGEWTEEMKRTFDYKNQSVRFVFIYR